MTLPLSITSDYIGAKNHHVSQAFTQLLGLDPDKRFLLDDMSRWIHVGSLKVNLAWWVDPLSSVMLLVITGIGGLIHFFSWGYMDDEPSLWRFYAYLNLFMGAMLTLVLGDSMLTLFVGWEGVGLCSYALIGFWYKEKANASAAMKAFVTNRIGDFGFVLGMFGLFWLLDAHGAAQLGLYEALMRSGTSALLQPPSAAWVPSLTLS